MIFIIIKYNTKMENVHTDVICLICQNLVDHNDYLNFCLLSKKIYNKIKKRKDTRPLIVTRKGKQKGKHYVDKYIQWKGKYTYGCFIEFSYNQTIHFKSKYIYTGRVNLISYDLVDKGKIPISHIANNSFGNSYMKDLDWIIEPCFGSLPDGTPFMIRQGDLLHQYDQISDSDLTQMNFSIPERIKKLNLPPYVFQGTGNWPEDTFLLFPEVHFLPYKTIFGVLVHKHLLYDVIREIELIIKIRASLYITSSQEKEICFRYENKYKHKNCLNTLICKLREYLNQAC